MALIPLDECEDRRIYRIRSRNLMVGAYRARTRGFIGIRNKFGEDYLFEEYHHDADPHFGTVNGMEPLDAWVPPEIDLVERFTRCDQHDRDASWNQGNGWYHVDDGSKLPDGDKAYGTPNQPLHSLLQSHHDEAVKVWQEQREAEHQVYLSEKFRPQTLEEHEREKRKEAAGRWLKEQRDAGHSFRDLSDEYQERLRAKP